ncbi:hypothetical protein Tco_0854510 [Tanacetum coccineum]
MRVVLSDEESLGEEDASKQGRKIADIDADEGVNLASTYNDEDMFGVNDLDGEGVVVDLDAAKVVSTAGEQVTVAGSKVSAASVNVSAVDEQVTAGSSIPVSADITEDELTLAQALEELKTSKPKAKRIIFKEPKRLAREKEEVDIALINTWEDIEAKIEADSELAQRLQAEEQKELTDAEKATLFCELLEQRRRHFAAKRAEAKRNKPPTKAQQRKTMTFKRVNTFLDFRTELVEEGSKKANTEKAEGSSKRARAELEQESLKKQKMDDDDDMDTTEL